MSPKRSILSAADPNNREYARQTYNDAWGLYLGLLSGTNTLEDMTKAREFFGEVIAAYQAHGMDFEEARAQHGLAVVSGLLGRAQDCAKAARRCVELLAPWLSPADGEKAEWAIKSLRVLADVESAALDRLRACKRGFDVLKRLPQEERWTHYRALFHRAAGVAEARRRPKTARSLRRGLSHLLEALALLESLPVDRRRLQSLGKTARELARVHRSLAALRAQSDPAGARELLERAERAARRGLDFDREAGNDSRWSHYHLAKILRDRGDREAAARERLAAIRCREQEREPFDADDHRIGDASDDDAIARLQP